MRHFQGRVIAYLEANWIWGDKLNGQIGAAVFIVVFVKLLGLSRIDVLDVNGLVGY